MADLRDQFIARVVPERTFADVGGLWGTVNEKVTVAAKYHARSLAMIDISTPDSELWKLFRDRLDSFSIGKCQTIAGDLCALAPQWKGHFEVVHCSGVLYHHPNPMLLLESLRQLATRHVILTSAVIHEKILSDAGEFLVPSCGAVFVPALSPEQRQILWRYWHTQAGVGECSGISEPTVWRSQDFGPWWWLFTPQVMLAMAGASGFRVVDSGPSWNGNAHTALLEAV